MTCDFCHLNYIEGDPEDRRAHAARHRRWEKAVSVLRYHPQSYREREGDKRDGHDLAHNGKTLADRLTGAERVLRAWFDRSLSAAIESGSWRKHPSFGVYVAMIDVPHAFPPEVWAELRRRYGCRPGVIPSGYSYWYPSTPDSPYGKTGVRGVNTVGATTRTARLGRFRREGA